MSTTTRRAARDELEQPPVELPSYRSILVGVDASDHSNRGVMEATTIGSLWQSKITGAHVYAASMHDRRFRQMEGGLPEQYKEEAELEKQRDIHDDLITKGLGVITDSYLDQVETSCVQSGLRYVRRSLEGKNYRELVSETNGGGYDLLILGALGLGAVTSSGIGTVCERVVRRSNIDTLVVKDSSSSVASGPILVAVDGSTRSYGGLLTGLSLAREWGVSLHVVSAYDPYYHYVAFNRIAGVLSEEAGKVFRFKEQEKLHEDIIDAGLAKIYRGHLEIAESIAREQGIDLTTKLLDGKPYEVIGKYASEIGPSLLIIGKLGIHADEALDIGGHAENLLRNVGCGVLLSQREFTPRVDVVAAATTSWTREAEASMEKVPSFARGMARMAVLRFAQERGHTVVTESIVRDATADLCPAHVSTSSSSDVGHAKNQTLSTPQISAEASVLLSTIDASQREAVRLKAEKKARQEGAAEIDADHVRAFVEIRVADSDAGAVQQEQDASCPFGFDGSATSEDEQTLPWTQAALERLERVPEGFMRNLTRKRVEAFARKSGAERVTPEILGEKYRSWGGATQQDFTLRWDPQARERIARIPPFVRGSVVKEIERCARELEAQSVTPEIVEQAIATWERRGAFHSEGNSGQYKR